MNKLEVKCVTKKIKDDIIINNANLSFEAGKTHILVGENGSGKTMLLRYIAGLMKSDEGELLYNDVPYAFGGERNFTVGLLLENVGLYNEFTLFDNLEMLSLVNKKASKQEIVSAIKRVGLDPYSKKTFGKFSLGMKKRAVIAQAILEKPDILLLDEPTNGLDKDGKKLFFDILEEEKQRGAIIIVSSHISEDIQGMADEIIQVENGCYSKLEKDII